MKCPELIEKFLHNVLGWHFPIEAVDFDGCSFTSKCRRCGKKILKDSQGNWFLSWEYGEIEKLVKNRPKLPPPRYRWRPKSNSIRKGEGK